MMRTLVRAVVVMMVLGVAFVLLPSSQAYVEAPHNIGKGGFHPREWQFPMEWAEVGKTAVFFHNGGAGKMCIGNYWYQIYPGGDWWNMSHGEPFLLRTFAGKAEKLIPVVKDVVAGKEAIAPCMIDGNKDDLHMK